MAKFNFAEFTFHALRCIRARRRAGGEAPTLYNVRPRSLL
jgi:hypothetical protein